MRRPPARTHTRPYGVNSAYSCCLSSGFFVFVSRFPTNRVGDGVAKAMVWMPLLFGGDGRRDCRYELLAAEINMTSCRSREAAKDGGLFGPPVCTWLDLHINLHRRFERGAWNLPL